MQPVSGIEVIRPEIPLCPVPGIKNRVFGPITRKEVCRTDDGQQQIKIDNIAGIEMFRGLLCKISLRQIRKGVPCLQIAQRFFRHGFRRLDFYGVRIGYMGIIIHGGDGLPSPHDNHYLFRFIFRDIIVFFLFADSQRADAVEIPIDIHDARISDRVSRCPRIHLIQPGFSDVIIIDITLRPTVAGCHHPFPQMITHQVA
ncbi:Uncharacterised protein [Klebsiella pneumoniae]|nr:Uncharacterised protein [Klebsiella pneumoniae]